MSSDPPLSAEELAVKAIELEVRRLEAKRATDAISSPWWRRPDPLTLAILAGVLTLLGNMAVAMLNNHNSLTHEQNKAADDLALEQTKAKYNLVLQAMSTSDATIARRNIHFFIDAGLLQDSDCKIRNAIDQDQPVLPSLSGVAPKSPPGALWAPEIATLYNFPVGFDGRGVTIGIVELGGSLIPSDLQNYFKMLGLEAPEVVPVLVDGGAPKSEDADEMDAQVMLDVETIGGIAPGARMRVYIAPNVSQSFVSVIRRAVTDGVDVLSIGWGGPESRYSPEAIQAINAALEEAARLNITVLVASGDLGVTEGLGDGHRHVDFPASSPWVLSVGGSALKSEGGRIISETAWRETGGGFSEIFNRPDWQSAVAAPYRDDGGSGRGIPDVVASAAPTLGIATIVHGNTKTTGGTSAAAPIWAGLIARLDQALGYKVGYINPRLYREIGPENILRNITQGDNGVAGVKGYSAGPGWGPVAGWGSPDGVKPLDWFRLHTNPPAGSNMAKLPCRSILR
jgi:kumamolisin